MANKSEVVVLKASIRSSICTLIVLSSAVWLACMVTAVCYVTLCQGKENNVSHTDGRNGVVRPDAQGGHNLIDVSIRVGVLPPEEGVGKGRSDECKSENGAEQHNDTSGVSQTLRLFNL